MQVRLAQDWFAPNAHLYLKSQEGRSCFIPDEYRSVLPARSKIIGEDGHVETSAPTAPVATTLRDFDDLREAADVVERKLQLAAQAQENKLKRK